MKKLIGLLVAGLTISVLMTGCSKPAEGDTGTTPAATTGSTDKPVTPTTPPASSTGNMSGTTGTTTPPATTGTTPPAATTGK